MPASAWQLSNTIHVPVSLSPNNHGFISKQQRTISNGYAVIQFLPHFITLTPIQNIEVLMLIENSFDILIQILLQERKSIL